MDEVKTNETTEEQTSEVGNTTEQSGQPLTNDLLDKLQAELEKQRADIEKLQKENAELKTANTNLLVGQNVGNPTTTIEEDLFDVFGRR